MVAINKILPPECTGEGCGGETGTCTDSPIHRGNAENRAPTTRNHRQAQPLVNNLYQGMTLDAVTGLYYERNRDYSPSLGRWMEQDPAQYINGASTYQFVNSSPVGNVDASGEHKGDQWYGYNNETFRRWAHREQKNLGQPSFTKDEIKELYKDWLDHGNPDAERVTERRSPKRIRSAITRTRATPIKAKSPSRSRRRPATSPRGQSSSAPASLRPRWQTKSLRALRSW